VKGGDEGVVELEQRLSASENDEAVRSIVAPHTGNRIGQSVSIGKPSATNPVRSHEVGIAECADGGASILLSPSP